LEESSRSAAVLDDLDLLHDISLIESKVRNELSEISQRNSSAKRCLNMEKLMKKNSTAPPSDMGEWRAYEELRLHDI